MRPPLKKGLFLVQRVAEIVAPLFVGVKLHRPPPPLTFCSPPPPPPLPVISDQSLKDSGLSGNRHD